MSRVTDIILLCEDKAHELFITRFLTKGWKVDPRRIRPRPYPSGKGSGREFVLNNLAQEAKLYRSRENKLLNLLIVVIDLDKYSLNDTNKSLNEKIDLGRQKDERIIYVTPGWHLETWYAFFLGETVNEEDYKEYKEKNIQFKNKYKKLAITKESHPIIDDLSYKCKNNNTIPSPPPSLIASCKEFDRIRQALK